MEINLKIKYHWVCDQGIEIPEAHLEALKEDAEDRIHLMMMEGFTGGELITHVRYGQDVVAEEDPDDGLSYHGHWRMVRGYDLSGVKLNPKFL